MAAENEVAAVGGAAGVGLNFETDLSGRLLVSHIDPGSSSAICGVQIHDELIRVGVSDELEKKQISDVINAVLGTQGSYITLGFRRQLADSVPHEYEAELMRGPPGIYICSSSLCTHTHTHTRILHI